MTDAPRREEWVLADAFDRAAPTYDAMVALSPGYHDQLRTAAEALVDRLTARRAGRRAPCGCSTSGAAPAPRPARCSTPGRRGGGSAGRPVGHRRRRLGGHGRAGRGPRRGPPGVTLVVSDAVAYLESLPSGSVDGVLAAYLLRNVPDRDPAGRGGGPRAAARRRARRPRVLRRRATRGARASGPAVCHGDHHPAGRAEALRRAAAPLPLRSVRDFDSVDRVCERLLSAGLVDVRHRSVPGWQHGIVHTVAGSAPS